MSGRATIFCDMDGVLCDFVGQALKELNNRGCTHIEDSAAFNKAINDCQDIPEFYLNLAPIAGSIEGYHMLESKYDVYILSAPSWDNPKSWGHKRIWVDRYLGDKAYKKLILTHNKGHFKGRALIDDRIKYGVDQFDGEHIHFGTQKFPDWNSVIKHLM